MHFCVFSCTCTCTRGDGVCSFAQLSVTVSYQVTIGSAKLSVVDKDQSVTTKSIRLAPNNVTVHCTDTNVHAEKFIYIFTCSFLITVLACI